VVPPLLALMRLLYQPWRSPAIKPGFDQAYGTPIWRYLSERDLVVAAQFNAAMTEASATVNLLIAHAAELSRVRTLVDVGGGQGGLLTTVLATYPGIETGILFFDQPHVIDGVQAAAGPTPDGRLQLGEDLFTAVPAGADVYVMTWILHDWDDAARLHSWPTVGGR
jgi:hypothetical protein